MARITRVLLAAAAAVAAAGLAIAIVSSVSGHHAIGGVVAPAAPEAVGRRASAAALFRSLRDRAFGGAAASAAAVGEAVDSAKEAVLALGPTPTPASAAAIFGSLRDRAFGGAAASAAAVGEAVDSAKDAVLALGPTPTPASAASIFGSLRDRALGGAAASASAVGDAVDSAKEAVLALGPTYTPLAVSTGQALQAQLLAAQNAAYGLAQVRKAARRRECARVPRHRLASPHPTARAHAMRSASRAAWAAALTRCSTRTSRAPALTSSRPRTSYRFLPTLPASLPATCASRSTTPAC